MSDHGSGYKHDASDRKLDQSAEAVKDATSAKHAHDAEGPGHDPAEIAKHDDKGKDRLFEHREQHDDAEMQSEKTRHARDVARHDHGTESGTAQTHDEDASGTG